MISFFFYRLGENGRTFLSTAGRCLLYSLLLEIPFRFFLFFFYSFLFLDDIYIQILSIHFKNATRRNKKICLRVDSRPFLDTSWTATTSSPEAIGNHRSSTVFNDKPIDRPTDRPTSRQNIFHRFRKRKRITARRYKHRRTGSLPYRVSVGVISTRAARALRASTEDAQSVEMRAHHVRRMRVACKFEIDIYRSTHIYIYINYRPL